MGDPSMVRAEPSLFIDATAAEPTSPPAGFSAKGQAMGDPDNKELQKAYWERGIIIQQALRRPLTSKEVAQLVVAPVNKEFAAGTSAEGKVVAQDKSLAARKQSETDKREFDKWKLQTLQEASVKAAATMQEAKKESARILASGKFTDFQKGEMQPLQKEMEESIQFANVLLLKLRAAEVSGEELAETQSQATQARIAANEATERYKNWMKENGGGSAASADKVRVVGPDGKKYNLPKSQLEDAIRQGYKQE